nr:adenosine receptor A2a-like [Lytechinus pictus]
MILPFQSEMSDMSTTRSPEVNEYAFNNPPLHQALVMIFFTPLILIIIFGNALVIVATYKEPRLRTQRYIILASLALSDLCIGLIATPLELYSRVVQDDITCSVAKSGYFTAWLYVLVYVSIVHIVLITVDRLIALKRPLRYVALVTTKRVCIVIAVVWTGGISYGIVSVIESGYSKDDTLTQFCTGVRYTSLSARSFLLGSASAILFLGIILISLNIWIHRIAVNHSRRIHQNLLAPPHPRIAWQGIGLQQLKATKTTLLVVGMFCMGWFPTSIWFYLRVYASISHVGQIILFELCFFIANFSSAVNPFIYCFKDSLYRRTFCKIFPPLGNVLKRSRWGFERNSFIELKDGVEINHVVVPKPDGPHSSQFH